MDFEQIDIELEAATLDEQHGAVELSALLKLADKISYSGINRGDVVAMESAYGMKDFTDEYPVKAFTEFNSQMNVEVAMESIFAKAFSLAVAGGEKVYEIVLKVIKAIRRKLAELLRGSRVKTPDADADSEEFRNGFVQAFPNVDDQIAQYDPTFAPWDSSGPDVLEQAVNDVVHALEVGEKLNEMAYKELKSFIDSSSSVGGLKDTLLKEFEKAFEPMYSATASLSIVVPGARPIDSNSFMTPSPFFYKVGPKQASPFCMQINAQRRAWLQHQKEERTKKFVDLDAIRKLPDTKEIQEARNSMDKAMDKMEDAVSKYKKRHSSFLKRTTSITQKMDEDQVGIAGDAVKTLQACNTAIGLLVSEQAKYVAYFSEMLGKVLTVQEETRIYCTSALTADKKGSSSNFSNPSIAKKILVAVGGRDNIEHVEGCITRIRFTLKTTELVDTNAVAALGFKFVTLGKTGFQIIAGTSSEELAAAIMTA
ncbi:hypothetical protein [Vibrio phage vB_VmeM-Yong XC32]|nr:hypothetical protein [Vibrio phage vB_VmeM-Yong XC31]QAX96335.1 hypothetical protein [Vibrio phage vB_VmeM-Yong XC32]QAX96653.1 hypothetical protein [Vibrio phage vB_VmeM-Yong MS31]QAX96971.1 hypothetical protein [Vibrio phage vB_VmeM-Yong MS32]